MKKEKRGLLLDAVALNLFLFAAVVDQTGFDRAHFISRNDVISRIEPFNQSHCFRRVGPADIGHRRKKQTNREILDETSDISIKRAARLAISLFIIKIHRINTKKESFWSFVIMKKLVIVVYVIEPVSFVSFISKGKKKTNREINLVILRCYCYCCPSLSPLA